jgi:hypothetical protein
VALCQARISTKPLWGFSSSNPYHSQSRAEQQLSADALPLNLPTAEMDSFLLSPHIRLVFAPLHAAH